MKQIIINSEELQVRVAVVDDGKLQDFFMERNNKDRIVGSIYKGRIKNLEPSLQAAFVDIGVGKNAFLHYWDMLPATQEMLEDGGDDDDNDDSTGEEESSTSNDAPRSSQHQHQHQHHHHHQRAAAENNGHDAPAEEASQPAVAPAEATEAAAPSAEVAAAPKAPAEAEQIPAENSAPAATAPATNLLPPSKVPGLLPLSKSTTNEAVATVLNSPVPGILPLTKKTEAPAPAPAQAPAPAPAPAPAAEIVTTATIAESPIPPAQQQQFRNQGKKPQAGQQDFDRQNQQVARSRNRGGHRRRGRGGKGLQPNNRGEIKPQKEGFFQRLCHLLLPSSWFTPKHVEVAPQSGKGGHGGKGGANQGQQQGGQRGGESQLLPLNNGKNGGKNANAGAAGGNQLLPLGGGEKGAGSKPQQPPKPPKKQEKKGPTVEDIPNLFKVDQEILVQVTKGPIGTKGARVTTNLSIPGRYLVLLPNCSHVGISRRVEDHEERKRLKEIIRTLELPPNMGLICRTVGAGIKREHFQRDLDMLLDAWRKGEETAARRKAPVCIYQEPALTERVLRDSLTQDIDEIVVDSQEAYDRAALMLQRFGRQDSVKLKLYNNPTPVFIKYGIATQIENISNRKVMLPSGGYLCIDETEALIAIDVNTGKNRSGKDQPETILETNMEAVKEIARQLRLRNIGGLVVLDLIDMRSRKDQMAVFRAFKQYTSEDHARIKIYPISGLGLLEMSRQRESESLESTMFESCPCCNGRGLVKTATSVSVEIQRRLHELMARKKDNGHFALSVSQKVMDRIRTADQRVIEDIGRKYNCTLEMKVDHSLRTTEEYKLLDKVTGKEY